MRLKISLLFLVLAGGFAYYVFKGGYFTTKQEGGAASTPTSSKKEMTSEDLLNTLHSADLRDYEGNKFHIPKEALAGKNLIFHFWASWCGPCVNEVPELIAYSKKNPDVKFVIVSVDEYQDDIAKFMKSFPEFNSGNYIKIWDGDKKLTNFAKADRLPMSFILRPGKNEVQKVVSVVDWKNFKL